MHDVARCPEDDGGCNPSRVGLIPARASTCPRGLTERHSASNRDDGSSILSVGADAFVAQGTSTGVRSQGKLSVEDGRNSGEVKLELGLAVKYGRDQDSCPAGGSSSRMVVFFLCQPSSRMA